MKVCTTSKVCRPRWSSNNVATLEGSGCVGSALRERGTRVLGEVSDAGTSKVEGVDRVYRADHFFSPYNSGRRARVAKNLREKRLRHRRTRSGELRRTADSTGSMHAQLRSRIRTRASPPAELYGRRDREQLAVGSGSIRRELSGCEQNVEGRREVRADRSHESHRPRDPSIETAGSIARKVSSRLLRPVQRRCQGAIVDHRRTLQFNSPALP